MVDDLTKKGTEGTSPSAPIVDLSPQGVKTIPAQVTNAAVAVGIGALTTIASIIARAGVEKIIHDKEGRDIAAGKTVTSVNPDYIDGGMIAGGIGFAAMTKNSYARACGIGVSTGGLVNLVLRKYPRISQPFATKVTISSPAVEW